MVAPVLQARTMFPVQAALRRQPLPPDFDVRVAQSGALIGLPAGLQPSFVWLERLPGFLLAQEPPGSPTFSTLLSMHATPCGPRQTLQHLAKKRCCCVGFRCVTTVAVCFIAFTRRYQTSGKCAFPCGLHGSLCTLRMIRSVLFHLLHIRNTRYGWLARPSPVGTSTPQETPSFAWRTNAGRQAPPIAGVT